MEPRAAKTPPGAWVLPFNDDTKTEERRPLTSPTWTLLFRMASRTYAMAGGTWTFES